MRASTSTTGTPEPGSGGAEPAGLSTARRLLVVHNPVPGRRRGRRLERTLAALRGLGCTVQVRRTAGPGDAGAFARAAGQVDAVVVAGGDGTVNEALNGLAAHGARAPALAVIPLGTANVLAHELGLPLEPAALARAIAFGPAVPAHLGAANGRRFAVMAGAGFDAHVVAGVRPRAKRALGKGAYLLAALEVAARFRHPRYRVEVDGAVYDTAAAVVCKGHFYAGTYVLAPAARPWRPDVQVALFERGGTLQLLRYAAALQLGRLQDLPGFRVVAGRQVRIDGPAGDPVQGDGDLLTRLPLQVGLLDHAVRFVMPETPAA